MRQPHCQASPAAHPAGRGVCRRLPGVCSDGPGGALSAGRPRGGERGLSESVQWAILGTAFLACLLGLIEAGLVLHGRSVAVAAALAGSNAQAVLGAGPAAGAQAAGDVAAAGGLVGVAVTVTPAPGTVTVRVEAKVPTFFGWVTPLVRAESTRPWEGP